MAATFTAVPGHSQPSASSTTLTGQGPYENPALHMIKGDKVDQKVDYLWESPQSQQQQELFAEFLKEKIFPLSIPEGYVVELGVWKCDTYRLLEQHYGASRCRGFDLVNYSGRSDILIRDVRDLGEADAMPIALGRNHVSSWSDSFHSRLAGLRYLAKNLVVGGYLIEAGLHNIPKNIRLSGFSPVLMYKNVLVLKKVCPSASAGLA